MVVDLTFLHKTMAKTDPISRRTRHFSVDRIDQDTIVLSPGGIRLPKDFFPEWVQKGHQIALQVSIESKHSGKEWALAFAKQALSELVVYKILTEESNLPPCHRLHALQMATEKIAKAYRLYTLPNPPSELTSSHVAVREFFRAYVRSPEWRARYQGRDSQGNALGKQLERIARQVEMLAPAVDDDTNPQNVEYPWSDGVKLHTPRDYNFPAAQINESEMIKFVEELQEIGENLVNRLSTQDTAG